MARPRKYSVLFGFVSDDPDTTGYVGETGPVHDIFDAILFERENFSRRKGWRDPSAWARFFEEETEYSGWKLHPVGTCRIPGIRKENTTI